jgi:putative FmdB family regulatory protein
VPTYQYACTACGHELEAVQAFSDDPLTVCPACEGRLRKVFSAVGIVFKGSGFYRTDSRKAAGSEAGSSSGSGAGEKAGVGASSSDKSSASTSEKSSPSTTSSSPSSGSSAGSGSSSTKAPASASSS